MGKAERGAVTHAKETERGMEGRRGGGGREEGGGGGGWEGGQAAGRALTATDLRLLLVVAHDRLAVLIQQLHLPCACGADDAAKQFRELTHADDADSHDIFVCVRATDSVRQFSDAAHTRECACARVHAPFTLHGKDAHLSLST